MLNRLALGAFAIASTAAALAAQQSVGPPVRQLGAVVATSKESFGPLITLRHTAKGLLVNDIRNRRLLRLDPTLADFTVVADSTPATASAYSGQFAGLIPYRGDSTLFVDQASISMLVVDPDGKVARVMALPRPRDAMVLANTTIGAPGFDAQGRLVYRAMPAMQFRAMAPPGGGGGAMPAPPEQPDTAPIVRVNLETRATDTIGYVKVPRPKMDVNRDESTGRMSFTMTMNPLPTVDEFAVLTDGSVAFLRGRDYHVDWIRPDGSRESSPKMPFNWQRLSDEDKVAFIDSLKAARERVLASQPDQAAPAPSATTTTMPAPGGGQQRQTIVMGGPGAGGAAGGNPMAAMMNNRNVSFVPANELPDYKPPFFAAATRADADGNLWVQTIPTRATAGGPIYDVVNGNGELIDRVQVPKDRLIVGFGAGGVVYLAVREGLNTKLEKAKLK